MFFVPTILELFGDTNWQSQIPTTVVDCHSLIPILLNTTTSVRPWAFSEVFRVTPLASDGKTIRNQDYKLLKFANGTQKFYNLTLNPTENNDLLLTTMSATDITNYNYLCSQLATLVGTSNCSTLNSDSFLSTINEIYVIENPFKSKINLSTISNDAIFELYSIKGEKIYEGKDLASKDFSYLAKGIYFLKVLNQQKAFKIIKE